VEHVRVNLITADPQHAKDVVHYLETDVPPRLSDLPGERGITLLSNLELGVILFESFWVSGEAMKQTERAVEPLRKEAVRRGGGTVTVEPYQVAGFDRAHRPPRGAGVRFTRYDVDPNRVDEAIAAYEDIAVPWLLESDGFCSSLLLVHRRTGRTLTEDIWRDHSTLAASRSAATTARADAVAAADSLVRALEEYTLDLGTIRPD
jgi:hypothetical protein